MEVWPAIDLLGGQCVRLRQGDYGQSTVFGNDGAAMAAKWFAEGADRLHVVDLDAARSGSVVNHESIAAIVETAEGRSVQVGGGVRSDEVIERYLDLGVDRLVVGTAALRNPEWFAKAADRYPGHLVLGLDARDGMVSTAGWQEVSQVSAETLIQEIAERTSALAAVVYTDIARDGMMSGPNFDAYCRIQKVSPFPVIASGGVTTLDDVRRLADLGADGAIIGRTLYEGKIQLGDALAVAAGR